MTDLQIGQLVLSLAVLVAFAAPTTIRWFKHRRVLYKRRKFIEEKLGAQNPKELIEASPFEYAHWQGEDGYRIIDDREDPPYVGFADSAEEAELQILSRIFSEEE